MNKYWGSAIIVVGIMLSLWTSCSETKFEQTLMLAGANRAELEKVLRHYEGDERKHRAALFLLERMANCYTYDAPRIDSMKQLKYLSSLPDRGAWTDSVKKVWAHVPTGNGSKVYDAQVISAEFLISHIDHVFQVWDSRPWAMHYSFEEFCRYVLPYRLADEPLEAWREAYYRKYAARVDSIYPGNDIIRKIQAVETVFHEEGFGWNELFSSLPHLGAGYLLEHPIGVCRESCDFSVYLLRALGIPAVTDTYIASPHTSGAHSWNAVRDTTGLVVPFWLSESKVGRGESDGRPKGKVLVIGIGVGLYLCDYREKHPMRKAHTMFERAHSLHKAGEWEASTEILKETMRISSDAMILNIIGKNCQALGEYREAEEWFIRSTHRLPNRIYPSYLLAKLYAEHPKYFPREKLEWAVRMVLEKEAKVESTAIKQMREEVKVLLDENQ